MAKPDDLPNWATDTDYAAGADPWSATPTKVEPGSPQKAAGWEPSQKPPAQYMNFWQNLVYLWFAWIEAAIGTPRWTWYGAGLGQLFGGAALTDGPVGPAIGLGIITGGDNSGATFIPVNFPVGAVVDKIGVNSFGDATADLDIYLFALDSAGGPDPVIVANLTISGQSASWAVTEYTIPSPYTVPANTTHWMGFNWTNAAGSTTNKVNFVGARVQDLE